MEKLLREDINIRLQELKEDRETVLELYKKASNEQVRDAYYKLWSLLASSYDYLYDVRNEI